MKPERFNVLGVGVSAIDLTAAVDAMSSAIRNREKGYICVRDVHGIVRSQDDEDLRQIHNHAHLCTPDGMPLVWLGRLNGFSHTARVYGPDLMLETFKASLAHGWRHFFFGGADGVALELKEKMLQRFPGLEIVGIYEPPFRPLTERESKDLREQVKVSKPDIIWVGLGTPKQEMFMAEFLPVLDTTLMVGVGAAFDFHSGRIRQAPRWLQRAGLEWLFRLAIEPRRLWRRYLVGNPRFVFLCFLQLTGLKKFSL